MKTCLAISMVGLALPIVLQAQEGGGAVGFDLRSCWDCEDTSVTYIRLAVYAVVLYGVVRRWRARRAQEEPLSLHLDKIS